MKRIIFLVFLLATFPVHAAGAFVTGNELYQQLVDYKRSPSNNVITAAAGTGFVVGVADSLDEVLHPPTGFKFCTPSTSTKGQVIDVVLLYLENHPQDRHLTASSLVQAALTNAFPCKR